MASFSDNDGRQWEIRIDAPAILRIREDCDPSFLLNDDSDEHNTYSRMQADPVLLCRVIYLLCEKQRTERGINEEDFYMQVIGDAIDSATDAMLKAIISFIPRRTRGLLEASAAKTRKIQQIAVAKAMDRINDPKLEQELIERFERQLNGDVLTLMQPTNVTSSPAGLESTPPV